MTHLDEGAIHAWLDGELGTDEAQSAESHVRECTACSAAVAEARGLVAASSRIMGALDDVPANVIPASAPVRKEKRVWRAAPWVSGIAAVLLAGVVLRTNDVAREQTTPMPVLPPVVATTEALPPPVVDTAASREVANAATARKSTLAAPVPSSPPPAASEASDMAAEGFAARTAVLKRETAIGLVGCYNLAVAISQPTPVRQLSDDAARGARRESRAAMPSVAATNAGTITHRLVRLELAPRDSGFVARDVRADSIIGSWKAFRGDTAEAILLNGLRVRVPVSARADCPN